ncbi:MAG: hypothetical protein COB15_02280 [Flavobacteriales bacterium]|nr:MAG: hypothetical protein COB15_02280 [Flavobacteriales bacterium]
MACGGDAEHVEETVVQEVINEEQTLERVAKAQMVFQTIPSPLETASIFQDAGAGYNVGITNPVENVSNYATNVQMALNLGVYGADLSYANVFDQSQESMFYMNCTKKMADGLGITSAFDAITMERMEENMNNRDSLMTIINDAFWIADAHLKENGQDYLSALIITGGWIEGLYLGTKALNTEAPDDKLMQRIADQKYSLNNLTELLKSYNNAEVNELVKKLQEVQIAYNKIEETDAETTVSNDGGVATIGGGSTLTYQPETIVEITSTIEKIRNEIIQ